VGIPRRGFRAPADRVADPTATIAVGLPTPVVIDEIDIMLRLRVPGFALNIMGVHGYRIAIGAPLSIGRQNVNRIFAVVEAEQL